jgi:hypothetical protein
MRPFNPSVWNLLKPMGALALAACGPGLADDGGTTDDSNSNTDTGTTTNYTDYSDYYTDYSDYTTYTDSWDNYYNPCNYCAPDEACNGGECYTPGCEDNSDCDAGLACIDSACVELPESLTCGTWPTLAMEVPTANVVLAMQFVDVDNDGAHELVRQTLNGFSVLDDDLSLTETAWIELGQFSQIIAMRVDDDEFIDLAFTDSGAATLRTLLGNGDGSFGGEFSEIVQPVIGGFAVDIDLEGVGEAAVVVALAPSEAHQHLHHGDNDGDGQQDLLLAGLASDPLAQSAAWILQQDGNWPSGVSVLGLPVDQPSFWGALDLDGDGRDDAFSSALSVDGVLMQSWSADNYTVATLPDDVSLAWIVGAEFDGTNGEEVLLGTTTPRLVQRLNANPIGCSYALEGFPAGGEQAVAGDFDGDGIDEIAVLVQGVVHLVVSDN